MEIKNWIDVDAALEEMGQLDIELNVASAALAVSLHEILTEHAPEIFDLKKRREALEDDVNVFCVANKADFAKKRSKVLTFGKVAFKVSESIIIPEGMECVIISVLRKLGHTDCVIVKESIDKNAVKNLDDTDLAKCGLKRIKKDNFRIEPNLQIIAQKIGAEYTAAGGAIDLDKLSKLIPAPGGEAA